MSSCISLSSRECVARSASHYSFCVKRALGIEGGDVGKFVRKRWVGGCCRHDGLGRRLVSRDGSPLVPQTRLCLHRAQRPQPPDPLRVRARQASVKKAPDGTGRGGVGQHRRRGDVETRQWNRHLQGGRAGRRYRCSVHPPGQHRRDRGCRGHRVYQSPTSLRPGAEFRASAKSSLARSGSAASR